MKLVKTILIVGELVAAMASIVGAAPKAVIVVSNLAPVAGDDIFLDSSKSGPAEEILARHWSIVAVPPTALVPGREQFDLENPIRPRLKSYPGQYTVTLRVVDKRGDIVETEVVITIGGGATPCPPPIPCPACPDVPPPKPPEPKPPEPTPIVPTPPMPPAPDPNAVPLGEFGIAPKVAEIVKGITDPNKMQNAKTLADAADTLAAQIAAGTVTDAQDVLVKFGEAIKVLQSPGWSAAAPKFSTDLAVVYAMNKVKLKVGLTGVIMDRTGWSTLVKECGIGVRAGAMLK